MLMSELPWHHDGLLGATLEKPLSFGSSVMPRTVSHFFNFLSLFSPQFLPLFRSLRIFLCWNKKLCKLHCLCGLAGDKIAFL